MFASTQRHGTAQRGGPAGLWAAAAAFLALAVAPARAQQQPAMNIEGYETLAWGADIADVVAIYGETVDDELLETDLRMLAFEDSLAGRPSVLLFGFLDGHGLVKVQQVVAVDTSGACVEYIRELHRLIDVRYPLIRPNEEARNNSPDVICKAAAEGRAFWHRQWRDEETGSVVTVSLPSGSDRVRLTYESVVFRDWIRAEAGAPRSDDVPDSGAEAAAEIEAVP